MLKAKDAAEISKKYSFYDEFRAHIYDSILNAASKGNHSLRVCLFLDRKPLAQKLTDELEQNGYVVRIHTFFLSSVFDFSVSWE